MSRQRPIIKRNRDPCGPPTERSTNSFWHSQPSALLTAHRSTRELPKTADVVIIGSGMTGASVAHHLLNEGKANNNATTNGEGPNVVMLEAREACWGATGRNGGHCQPLLYAHPHEPEIATFELANFHTLQSLIDSKNIDCEFVAQPGVRAVYDQRHLDEVELALLTVQSNAPGIAQMMRLVTDKDELEGYRVPTAVGAVITTIAGRMWPYKFVSRILEDLVMSNDLNGTFNLQTLSPVESLTSDNNDRWTVKTSRGSISAAKVVLATNAYTSHLLHNFADLIVPCRGEMSALVPLPSVAGDKRLKTSFGFDGDGIDDYLIQRPTERGGHLMFGGGRQNGPSMGITDDSVIDEKTAQYLRRGLLDSLGLPEGESKKDELAYGCDYCRSRKVLCMRRSALRPCVQCQHYSQPCTNSVQNMPAAEKVKEFKATHEWSGIMGYSRDDHPWVGPVPDKPNLYVSAGYTGHGMPNTWLCGKAVALMVKKTLDGAARRLPAHPEARSLTQKFLTAGSMFSAAEEVGLPKSYLISQERILKAMELEDVESQDWAEMERGRRRAADRLPSGYA